MFNKDLEDFKFYSISLDSINSPKPMETEGGRLGGSIQICYKYSRAVDKDGRFK
jgi:hypothetical protein